VRSPLLGNTFNEQAALELINTVFITAKLTSGNNLLIVSEHQNLFPQHMSPTEAAELGNICLRNNVS